MGWSGSFLNSNDKNGISFKASAEDFDETTSQNKLKDPPVIFRCSVVDFVFFSPLKSLSYITLCRKNIDSRVNVLNLQEHGGS